MKIVSIQTKNKLQAYFEQLFLPTKQYRKQNDGRLKFGTSAAHYGTGEAQIEGFLRTLWAVGPLAGSGDFDLNDFKYYMNAIIHSTDPTDPTYWGQIENFDQLIVEMASLAVTLIETKNVFWDQLNLTEQNNIYGWLEQVNQVNVHQNNWRFFRVLVNVAFIKLGRAYSQDQLNGDLKVINACYLNS
ncbi:DUF2264 domain-containing protein [Lapidilactobacillus bayanensis]|uniref:DUF2264 domain-containing protein n=1 Tax=Lapidilactobacillus bayanensis TaxID=2485998 RepID=UPI0013DE2947|nr:DUF2264 domain-containing protein [Lapidilactobacillus bayanensis]